MAHLDAGVASPTDADVVRAAVSRAAWRSRHAVTTAMPISVQDLRRISRAIPATTGGCRDRALILVGYGAALRPGELVALRASDVAVTRRGLRIETRRGTVSVPPGSAPELCAVRAWREWAARVDLGSGPAFRSVDRHGRVGRVALGEHAVRRVVRRAAAAAGLDPTRFQGLSLRRGMVSAAAEAGVSRRVIMRQTGHRSDRLVRDYVRARAGPLRSAATGPPPAWPRRPCRSPRRGRHGPGRGSRSVGRARRGARGPRSAMPG
ncbi:MAG: hypothetical protein FJW77_01725 [Actinobacteria bacterium]|nr:hypothetical protein [Actinomycetota bacterium]